MTEDEERILSACEWIPNEVVVHWDDRVSRDLLSTTCD